MSVDYRTEHFRAWAHDDYLAVEEYRWDDWTKSWQTGRSFTLTVRDTRELQALVYQWQGGPDVQIQAWQRWLDDNTTDNTIGGCAEALAAAEIPAPTSP